MTSRVGVDLSLMYSCIKREGKSKPQAECTRPLVGAGVGRWSSEPEEQNQQMATSEADAKNSFMLLGSSGSVRWT